MSGHRTTDERRRSNLSLPTRNDMRAARREKGREGALVELEIALLKSWQGWAFTTRIFRSCFLPNLSLRCRRGSVGISEMLWRDLKVWQIFGANTDVGKSVVSTLLCKALAARARPEQVLYLKPVSTGPDGKHDHQRISHFAKGIVAKGVVQYDEAKSPHLAAKGKVSQPCLCLDNAKSSSQ